ncbi:MAG TPA: DUF6249 domain-containing protein [Gammaproteobacteria bacterium]|jgi:hypothetical protein|nr:DUF6249 domain-containing protein [Gammaproteobacteria bacterium]
MGSNLVFLVPVAALIGVFSFVAVASWAINRRRERESLYHGETVRKISEAHGQQAVLDYISEVERIRTRRLQSAYTVGGIIAACGGAGLTIFLWADRYADDHTYYVGLIPLFIGLGLIAYTQVLWRKT